MTSCKRLLVADHGAERWGEVVQRNCRVWLELAARSPRRGEDLYEVQLGELKVGVTFIHGRHDPRTEPGEMEQAQKSLPGADVRFIENGRHSPHSEKEAGQEFNQILREAIAKN